MDNMQPDFVDFPAWGKVRANYFNPKLLKAFAPLMKGQDYANFVFIEHIRDVQQSVEQPYPVGRLYLAESATFGVNWRQPKIIVPNEDWKKVAEDCLKSVQVSTRIAVTADAEYNDNPPSTMLGDSTAPWFPDKNGELHQVMLYRDSGAPSDPDMFCTFGGNCSDALPLSFAEHSRRGQILFKASNKYLLPNFILPGQTGNDFAAVNARMHDYLASDTNIHMARERAAYHYKKKIKSELPIEVVDVPWASVPAFMPLERTINIVDLSRKDRPVIARSTGMPVGPKTARVYGIVKAVMPPPEFIRSVGRRGFTLGSNFFPLDMRPGVGEFGTKPWFVSIEQLITAAAREKGSYGEPALLDSSRINFAAFEKYYLKKAMTIQLG